jgi:hypothetical protein
MDMRCDMHSIKGRVKTTKALNTATSANSRKRRLENKIKWTIIAREAQDIKIRIQNG